MQRKLISFDIFETIERNSLSNAFVELSEATETLGDALGLELVSVHCYDDSSVVYECADGTFVKANFKINEKEINFNNIEELVIDEETEIDARKNIIGEMVDALTNNDTDKADLSWGELKLMLERVMKRGRSKKSMVDMYDDNMKKAGKNMCESKGMVFVRHGAKNTNKSLAAKRGWTKRRGKEPAVRAKMKNKLSAYRANRNRLVSLKSKAKSLNRGGVVARAYYTRTPKSKVNEWYSVLENFYNYVGNSNVNDYTVSHNEQGDVASVTVPTIRARNEGKVIQIKLDVLKADVKILRENAHKVVSTPEFSKAVSQLKKYNNISDNEGLEECISNIIGKFPAVLGLSESELADAISNSLKFAGETNYDDQTTKFMAEGILRTAFEAFPEKVETVLRLSDTEKTDNEDAYLDFQARVADFYKKIDESLVAETKLVIDIYNAVSEVGSLADSVNDTEVKADTSVILSELEPVLESNACGTLDVAEVAAEWLVDFMENSIDPDNTWGYVDNPEVSASGDTSKVRDWSKFTYAPSQANEFGDSIPQIGADTMNLMNKDGTTKGWGNVNGPNTWDKLSNPYQLPRVKYVGPKGEADDVDSNDAFGTFQSKDTWEDGAAGSLANPYLPRNLRPARPDMGQSDKWSN